MDLAYDGTDFRGWARQPGLRTVQGVLEDALAMVLRLDGPPATVCAGRTDAGVHARGQVVHVDLDTTGLPDGMARRLTGTLPPDIVVRDVSVAPHGFDARFSAISREYAYRMWDHPDKVDPLTRCYTLAYPHELDVARMSEAAGALAGLHDFAAFCQPKDHGTTVRTLLELTARRQEDSLVVIHAVGDAFCHSMVRSLVGALVAVGRGKRDRMWIEDLLRARKRANDVTVMPASGLTLEAVTYPPASELADRADKARARRQLEDET